MTRFVLQTRHVGTLVMGIWKDVLIAAKKRENYGLCQNIPLNDHSYETCVFFVTLSNLETLNYVSSFERVLVFNSSLKIIGRMRNEYLRFQKSLTLC